MIEEAPALVGVVCSPQVPSTVRTDSAPQVRFSATPAEEAEVERLGASELITEMRS
jgi:hypothetical protein